MTRRVDDPRLTSDVHELRDATMEPEWAGMEGRLMHAFATRALAPTPRSPLRGWWRWTAAAAGIMLAAAITFYLPSTRRDIELGHPSASSAATKQAPVPAAPQSVVPVPPDSVRPPAAPERVVRERAPRTSRSRQEPRRPTFEDFMALPSAAGLPDFESGRIVRVELPLTALPAYGMDVVLDAAPVAVQADFLIGQDGVARAIRLASSPW